MIEKIILARKAGEVTRYHQNKLIHVEDVATHTFNVVNLVLILSGGHASRDLILAALMHDMGEYELGDIPAPTKRNLPQEVKDKINDAEEAAVTFIHPIKPNISQQEGELLTLADRIDGLLKCISEVGMGNMRLAPVGHTYVQYAQEAYKDWMGEEVRRAVGVLCEIFEGNVDG